MRPERTSPPSIPSTPGPAAGPFAVSPGGGAVRPGTSALLLLASLFAALLFFSPPARADDASDQDLDLEDLLQVEVVSAMRRPEPLSRVAAAVTVLDAEDIRRSGALSIPGLLRLVPGLHVSHMDADKWAVGARGFNGLLSSNLLVLVDGRPVTSPNYSGVIWSALDIPLDDIERVEVVRGPATSLWSLDSFNGVVSIVTKHAAATTGVHSVSTVGTNGDVSQAVRVGGGGVSGDDAEDGSDADRTLAPGLAWRVGLAGNYADGDSFNQPGPAGPGPGPGRQGARQWRRGTVSTRWDWTGAPTDAYSFQGAWTASAAEENFGALRQTGASMTRDNDNGYGQFVWDRATGLNSGWQVRSSYTRAQQGLGGLDSTVQAADLELQHLARPLGAHALMWGAGFRHVQDEVDVDDFTRSESKTFSRNQWTVFAQDQISLLDDDLRLQLGLKADGTGSGSALQPSLRASWSVDDTNVLWAAVSRSVRSPDNWRRDGSYELNYGGRTIVVRETRGLEDEELVVWEAGWRNSPAPGLSLDVSAFFNDYRNLVGVDLGKPGTAMTLDNILDGHNWGLEAALTWEATSFLSLRPSLSWIAEDFDGVWIEPRGESEVLNDQSLEGRLQILTRICPGLELDATLFYQSDPPGPPTDALNLDAALSWAATKHLRLELIGKNLFGPQEGFGLLEEDPSATLRVTWDF